PHRQPVVRQPGDWRASLETALRTGARHVAGGRGALAAAGGIWPPGISAAGRSTRSGRAVIDLHDPRAAAGRTVLHAAASCPGAAVRAQRTDAYLLRPAAPIVINT